jgi:tetratricopeptide (TPR) repeat protein
MKSISTAALAAAMIAGAAGLSVAPPAFAKKKEEAPKGPAVSPAVGAAIQKAKTALEAKDLTTAATAVAEVEAGAKSDDEKYFASLLRYLLESQKIAAASTGTNGVSDDTPLIAPLDAMIANPATPADLLPKFEYARATIAYNAKSWPTAIRLFTSAQQHGSTEADLPLFLARAQIMGGDPAGGLANLEKLVAAKQQPEDVYRFAIGQASAKGLQAQTVAWIKRWITAYPTAKNWRDALTFYGLAQQGTAAKLDRRQRVDLYRLMRASKTLPDQATYEDYAQAVMDGGLPDEAKSVIAEGKANGKILGPGSVGIQQIEKSANVQVAAEGSFAGLESKAAASPNGALSAQTGDAYLGRGDYAKAVSLYKQALTKGGVNNDEVNTHLGIALALTGDKAGAKTAFGLVTTPPRNDIAGFWTLWLDTPPVG